jgi:hypothetical protein
VLIDLINKNRIIMLMGFMNKQTYFFFDVIDTNWKVHKAHTQRVENICNVVLSKEYFHCCSRAKNTCKVLAAKEYL